MQSPEAMPDTCQPAASERYQLVEPATGAPSCSHATEAGALECGSKRNRDRQALASFAFVRLNPGPCCQSCGSVRPKAA